MEENYKIEPDYLKGFNEGYTIAQALPELAEQLARVDNDSVRYMGFKQGREQFQKEQLKERLPAWLKDNQLEKGQSSPSKAKDRDIEPEK